MRSRWGSPLQTPVEILWIFQCILKPTAKSILERYIRMIIICYIARRFDMLHPIRCQLVSGHSAKSPLQTMETTTSSTSGCSQRSVRRLELEAVS